MVLYSKYRSVVTGNICLVSGMLMDGYGYKVFTRDNDMVNMDLDLNQLLSS